MHRTQFNRLFQDNLYAETKAYLSRLTSQPSKPYIKILNNDLVKPLVDSGYWTKIDTIRNFATEFQQHNLIDLKNPTGTQLIEVNSPGWVALRGYTGNGTNQVLRTGFIPNNGVNFAQNDSFASIYVATNSAANSAEFGVRDTGLIHNVHLNAKWSDNIAYGSINSSTLVSVAVASSLGFFSVRRTASNALALNKNGSQIASNGAITVGRSTKEVYLLGYNDNGVATSFSTRRVPFFMAGSALSVNDLILSNIVTNFLTKLGAQ